MTILSKCLEYSPKKINVRKFKFKLLDRYIYNSTIIYY